MTYVFRELSLRGVRKNNIFQPAGKNKKSFSSWNNNFNELYIKFFSTFFTFETAENPADGKLIEIVLADNREAEYACRKMDWWKYARL